MDSLDKPVIRYHRADLPDEVLLNLHRQLLLPRLIEEKMLSLLRQGKISKWFSGIGQEAIAVGSTLALDPTEYIFTLHRNLGVFTARGIPLSTLFSQWQGKAGGFTKGRDRSFHFGAPEYGIIGMISHLGPQLSVADGVALAYRLKGEKKVCVAFSGEGGTSEGEFHEALNVAAVWDLPVIFIVENNGYGLSTTTEEQFRCAQIADKGAGYGMESLTIDGNNILEVYHTINYYAQELRERPRPVLIECMTFRMRGHEEASGVKYVPPELIAAWAEKDPVSNFEAFLLQEGLITEETLHQEHLQIKHYIETELNKVYDEPDVSSAPETEEAEVYTPVVAREIIPASSRGEEKRYIDAISAGLSQAMEQHPNLILMGQDIGGYGGVFKITEGLVEQYGPERVRNTPLCESAILGAALGLSLQGFKSMVEMQFADFVSCGITQIVNNLAKVHYRWAGRADVVIRMPCGAGTGAGPFHSQSNEAWFFHTPGLKIVYPSNPYDAKGLLLAAFADPNPVMYFEHKALYRKLKAWVPDDYYTVDIGKAAVVRSGSQATIITYGMGVMWALDLVEETHWDLEIIDLRSLLPLDYDTIAVSVKKTNRVLVLHEDTLTGGIGAEIAAYIAQHLFAYLDAPVMRTAGLDTPVPFAGSLEKMFLANFRLKKDCEHLLNF